MTSQPRPVLVVGAVNLDSVLRVKSLPHEGETVLAISSQRVGGGKAANQALAIARAGCPVRLWAAVGDDAAAGIALAGLADDGVDLSLVLRTTVVGTGIAIVCVADDGGNLIVVDAAANGMLTPPSTDVVEDSAAVVVSLEAPVPAVRGALVLARSLGRLTAMNASPHIPELTELVTLADVLVVNQGEAEALGFSNARSGASALRATVVVTRGAQGAECSDGAHTWTVDAPAVNAVDTVGAGDAFLGAFVAAVVDGEDLATGLRYAVAAGSLAVQQQGARTSPHRAEILALAGTLTALSQ
jgi:ribokinase